MWQAKNKLWTMLLLGIIACTGFSACQTIENNEKGGQQLLQRNYPCFIKKSQKYWRVDQNEEITFTLACNSENLQIGSIGVRFPSPDVQFDEKKNFSWKWKPDSTTLNKQGELIKIEYILYNEKESWKIRVKEEYSLEKKGSDQYYFKLQSASTSTDTIF